MSRLSSNRLGRVAVLSALSAALAAAVWRAQTEQGPPSVRAAAGPFSSRAVPNAVAPDNIFQFGVMTPGDVRTHKFTVRNDGTADLTLKLGSTTCKCTLANLRETTVAPGAATEIELEWRAEEPQFRFRQAALIATNDPRNPSLELAVEGSVRVKMATLPKTISLPGASGSLTQTLTALLFSQAYDQVRIVKVESTLPTVTAKVSDAPSPSAAVEHARWVREVILEKRPEERPGPFSGTVRIHYVGRHQAEAEEAGVYELPIEGHTIGDVTLEGRDVVGGMILLGQVERVRGKSTTAYVHFRNTPQEVGVVVKQVRPEWLQVSVGKPQRLGKSVVRVPLVVEVPAGAPAESFTERAAAQIVVETTHPHAATATYAATFAVAP